MPDQGPFEATSPESAQLRDKALKSLRDIRAAVSQEFPGAGERLYQFQNHVDTAIMSAEYLWDEAERMPHMGYRKTEEQKAKDAADQQKVINDLRARGMAV